MKQILKYVPEKYKKKVIENGVLYFYNEPPLKESLSKLENPQNEKLASEIGSLIHAIFTRPDITKSYVLIYIYIYVYIG